MAQQRVNPTRMELLRLKKRTQLAQKGHKLLKEKRDGLMQEFLKIVREAKKLRADVDRELVIANQKFATAEGAMTPQAAYVASQIRPQHATLTVSERNVMGVRIPDFSVSISETGEHHGAWEMTPDLFEALAAFKNVLPKLLQLAAIEKSAQLLAEEIEKTRRRVNALEHVLIPQLHETTRYIRMKLDEQERAAIITTMAVKKSIS